jgi:TonB family protein
MPSAPAPKAIATGPVINTPGVGTSGGSSSSGGSSGAPSPSQIPGAVGRHAAAGGGRTGGGEGGSDRDTQYGSPGGGGGRAGVDALPEPDFGPYIAELQRRIKRNWTPPSDNRNKRIVALFTIGRDGRLLGLRIQTSSGEPLADEAAKAAIRASAPFRPLPANYRQNDIDVQFIFDYNVFSGKRI